MTGRFSLELGGNWFEQQVATELICKFPGTVILHNLELYSHYLSLVKAHPTITQIDIVFITPFRIYVIEAKKWGFEIIGNREDYHWIGKSNAKTFIENISPILQNMVHMRTLKNALRMDNHNIPDFESCVCVPNGTRIVSDCVEVMELSQLIYKIKCDQMYFYEGKLKPTMTIDVKVWEEIISNIMRKQGEGRN